MRLSCLAGVFFIALAKPAAAVRNGTPASPDDYPYVGHLKPGDCAGTLIADRVFLTAAHCLLIEDKGGNQQEDPRKAIVHLTINGKSVLRREIKRRILSFEQSHELALLLLDRGGAGEKSIPYPGLLTRDLHKDEYAIAVGFGLHLRRDVRAHAMTRGTLRFNGYEKDRDFRQAVLLPLSKAGGQLPCAGDSGGPLLILQDGKPLLAGVASHVESESNRAGREMPVAESECLDGDFSYYIPVKDHLDWIRSTISQWARSSPTGVPPR